MLKLARVPSSEPAPERAEDRRIHRFRHRYFAFLSYSHKDEELADWLHEELEEFRVPHALQGRLTHNGVIPKRLSPIFRDREELGAADDLSVEIEEALASSHFLIVLCSPDAAKSRWTNAEIEAFKRTRPDGCVLAAILSGEPFASEMPGREAEECFPPALRQKFDKRGRPTGKRAEPLAADLREQGDGRRTGFLKLVAGMLGVGLDELVQREAARRHRRLFYIAAGSFIGMAIAIGLMITAIQARDAARDQRREAEGLVAFMLGDLKDKLEPIGKLDALDGVGAKVLAYYSKQDTSELTDAALLQRSRALSLMGEVAIARGDLGTAYGLYQEAAAGTAEAVRRKPDDPQRLFEHAQNQFYFADIAMKRGRLDNAETAFREYKRLADRMVAIEPNNMTWRMEVQNADANLGTLLLQQRRFDEAATQWAQAFRTIEALSIADPNKREYQQSLVESLAWYADAEKDAGHLQSATALRERHVSLLRQLASRTGDVNYRQRLIPAERGLGNLYAAQGKMDVALNHMRAAVEHADRLTPVEPDNSKWLAFAAKAKNNLAEFLLLTGSSAEAVEQNEAGCSIAERLLAKDRSVPDWRATLRECWIIRTQIALADGRQADAVRSAERAVAIAKTVKGTDAAADSYALGKTFRLLGDARRAARNREGAVAAWQAALAALPRGIAERPSEMKERAEILHRIGQNSEAKRLLNRLAGIGYRYPRFRHDPPLA
jgi:tetratricopeptide (TPR) repeat protein